jgi:hypothetical protein
MQLPIRAASVVMMEDIGPVFAWPTGTLWEAQLAICCNDLVCLKCGWGGTIVCSRALHTKIVVRSGLTGCLRLLVALGAQSCDEADITLSNDFCSAGMVRWSALVCWQMDLLIHALVLVMAWCGVGEMPSSAPIPWCRKRIAIFPVP